MHKCGDSSNKIPCADFIWPIYEYLINNNVKIKSLPVSSLNNEPITVHFITDDQKI